MIGSEIQLYFIKYSSLKTQWPWFDLSMWVNIKCYKAKFEDHVQFLYTTDYIIRLFITYKTVTYIWL